MRSRVQVSLPLLKIEELRDPQLLFRLYQHPVRTQTPIRADIRPASCRSGNRTIPAIRKVQAFGQKKSARHVET